MHSGDDGEVRLWKANYLDHWKCVATLKGDGQSQQLHPQAQVIKTLRNAGLAKWIFDNSNETLKKIILQIHITRLFDDNKEGYTTPEGQG